MDDIRSPCPAIRLRSSERSVGNVSRGSIVCAAVRSLRTILQLLKYPLQVFKLLSSLAKFSFRRQSLVIGEVLGGFVN